MAPTTRQRRTREPSRSKSAAVRLAVLAPSRRQLSKWQREQRARRLIIFGGLAALAVVLAIIGFGYWQDRFGRGQERVATVYGEPITLNQLVERLRPTARIYQEQLRIYEGQGQAEIAAQLRLQVSQLPDQVLNDLIEERLVAHKAEELGLTVTPDEVEAQIRDTLAVQQALNQPAPTPEPAPEATPGAEAAASPTAVPTPEGTPTPRPSPTPYPTLTEEQVPTAYQALLAEIGMSDADYREQVRAGLLRNRVYDALGADVPTSEEQVHARHILVGDEAKAREILDKLNAGAKWEDLVSESTDTATKDKGGDLGWFGRGVMTPAFEEAAFSLQPGQRSGVVQSPFGYHVIEVLERDPNRTIDEARLRQLKDQAYQAWLSASRSVNATSQLDESQRSWALRQVGLPRR